MSDDFEKDWLNNDDEDDDLDWLNADDEEQLPSTGELDLELDWMRDTEDEDQPKRDESRLGVTGQLDWLRVSQGASTGEDQADDDLVPDWLKEDAEEPEEVEGVSTIDESDIPDWLQDMDTSDTTAPTMDIRPDDDDIPEWLKEAEPPAKEDDNAPEWLPAEDEWYPQDTDEILEDEEVPDWLKDAETPAALTTAEVMAISSDHPLDDIPDWLLDADESEPEEEPVSEVPEWLSAEEDWEPADEEEDFLAEDEAVEEIPDWLRPEALDQEEEAIQMEEDAAFDALFGDELEPVEAEEDLEDLLSEASQPDFGNMFDDADFDAEVQGEEEDFDLLGDLSSQNSGLTGMLGEVDELAFLTEDSDSFDLLGQLAGDEDEDEFTDTPIADAVAGDEEFLSLAASQKNFKGSIEDDTLHNVELEDEFDLDALFGNDDEGLPAPTDEEDDPFRWFTEDQPTAAPSAAVDEDDLSWLQDIDEEALEEARQETAPQPAASIDDYLATLDDNTFQLPQTGELRAEIDFDALLDENLFDVAETEEKTQLPQTPDMPEWLADISAQTTDEKSAAAIVRKQKDRPLDELNDRLLQLRDRGLEFAPTEAPEDEDLERILPGVKETLPEVTFEPTEATAIAPGLQLTMDQRRRADLLRDIVGADDEAAEEAGTKRRRLPIIERVALTVILLLLVAVPFFTDALNIGDAPASRFAPSSREMAVFDRVDALQPGDYVLIAADYGATSAAELDTSLEAVMRHALLRGAHPVIVSGSPVGLLRAGALMDTIAEESNLVINQDYTIGNYLVGDVVGLRNFAENVDLYISLDTSGESTNIDITTLDEFALVIVAAESADRLRGWVEQVAPITDTPMLAITGFSAEPLSEPYLTADSLSGYLVGYEDGYTYSVMLNTIIGGGSLEIPPTTEAPPTTEVPPTTEIPTSTPVPTLEDGGITSTPEDGGVIVPVDVTPSNTPEPSPTQEGGEAQIAPSNTPQVTSTFTPSPAPSNTPEPSATPVPTNTPTPEVRQVAIITVEGAVNVRAVPSTSGDVVSALRTNNRADIIGQTENELGELWYNIRFIDPFTGFIAEGWVREDLIQVSQAGTELTPVPSPTSAEPTAEPTPTREGASLKVPPVLKLQGDDEPTPTREGEVIAPAAATPEVTPELTAEFTPEITPELTAVPTITPVPTEVSAFARVIQPMDTEQQDERWFSMTLGLIGAILIIAGGSIINILRVLRRRND